MGLFCVSGNGRMEKSSPLQGPNISFSVIRRQGDSEEKWLFLESQYFYHRRENETYGGPEKIHILARIILRHLLGY
jgi:hypothetical protein